MLRWLCGYTRREKIRNDENKVGVALMLNKMREARLREFGYLGRRSVDAAVRRYERSGVADIKREEVN